MSALSFSEALLTLRLGKAYLQGFHSTLARPLAHHLKLHILLTLPRRQRALWDLAQCPSNKHLLNFLKGTCRGANGDCCLRPLSSTLGLGSHASVAQRVIQCNSAAHHILSTIYYSLIASYVNVPLLSSSFKHGEEKMTNGKQMRQL